VIPATSTVLSSIPSVLLIAAFVLMIGFVDNNPQMFETGLERGSGYSARGDPGNHRLGGAFARLLRAGHETLQLTDTGTRAPSAFPIAASCAGILPNVMHVVLMSRCSISRASCSTGGALVRRRRRRSDDQQLRHDINSARTELSRDPGRVVESPRCIRVLGRVRAVDAALRERSARGVRPARARVPPAPIESPASAPAAPPSTSPAGVTRA
jgi:hypothetical protein